MIVANNLFVQIEEALVLIEPQQYRYKNPLMSGATVGQHVRHVIELFQEMINGYRTGEINYENRQRNFLIETDIAFAIQQMRAIADVFSMPDKNLLLTTAYADDGEDAVTITSNYTREMIYNIEHTIHHMALIRIAYMSAFNIELNEAFGVAPSTIKYRKACAQ
jgi:hypothetical protein